ncbi:MAG: imidazole glycerol phosphate synthase subunit HisH [Candidatus Omnitrophota bacterium]
MSKKVAIIDYGMGNLYSVANAFKALGFASEIIASPKNLENYEKLILPGVGAFGDAMQELKNRHFIEPIKCFVDSGRPFLGICLGMQLLFSESCESPGVKGLDIIPGEVRKFSSRLKCPHMGWNKVEKCFSKAKIFKGLKEDLYTYFCHSYYVKPKDKTVIVGQTRYGVNFASIVQSGRVYGMQFHPEKSQEKGLLLLRNFIELC